MSQLCEAGFVDDVDAGAEKIFARFVQLALMESDLLY